MNTLSIGARGTGTKVHIVYGAATYCSGRGGANVHSVKVIERGDRTNREAVFSLGYTESSLCTQCFGK